MNNPTYTEADVDTVANAVASALGVDEFASYSVIARRVLDALAAAGRLSLDDVAYRAGRDSAWADAIGVVGSASPNGKRALEAYQAALLAGLRISARLTERGDAGPTATQETT